jgi:uncharacterized protein (DUF1778 family)
VKISIIPIRLTPQARAEIESAARHLGETLSGFIRVATEQRVRRVTAKANAPK